MNIHEANAERLEILLHKFETAAWAAGRAEGQCRGSADDAEAKREALLSQLVVTKRRDQMLLALRSGVNPGGRGTRVKRGRAKPLGEGLMRWTEHDLAVREECEAALMLAEAAFAALDGPYSFEVDAYLSARAGRRAAAQRLTK